jgi:hypothetical protein
LIYVNERAFFRKKALSNSPQKIYDYLDSASTFLFPFIEVWVAVPEIIKA